MRLKIYLKFQIAQLIGTTYQSKKESIDYYQIHKYIPNIQIFFTAKQRYQQKTTTNVQLMQSSKSWLINNDKESRF